MYLRKLLLPLLMGAVVFGSCNDDDDPLVFDDPNEPVEVNAGSEFYIELHSNPTTGYTWEFIEPIDTLLLKLLDHEYVGDPNPDHKEGVGGRDVWHFLARQSGNTMISLIYHQPFNPDDPSAEEALFDVTIR
jgi:inhibitor of cysteine peptidase